MQVVVALKCTEFAEHTNATYHPPIERIRKLLSNNPCKDYE